MVQTTRRFYCYGMMTYYMVEVEGFPDKGLLPWVRSEPGFFIVH